MPGTVWKRGHKDQGFKAKARRSSALGRLELHLERDNRELTTAKVTHSSEGIVKFFQGNINRETKEIETLKTRI